MWGVVMYRELVVKAYGKVAVKKVDKLRKSGVDMTDLIMSAIMLADIEQVLKEQRAKRELVCKC
jgi:hypothetical protein